MKQPRPRLSYPKPRLAAPKPRLSAPTKTARHYGLAAHREWAITVKQRAGYRCEDCSAQGDLIADHVVELKDGGDPLDPANGRARCRSCHAKKTHRARMERLT